IVAVALVSGIHANRHERELNRRALSQHVENVEQRPAILAARKTDHDTIAVLDQSVFGDPPCDLLVPPRFKRPFVRHVRSTVPQNRTETNLYDVSSVTVSRQLSFAPASNAAAPMRSAVDGSVITRRSAAASDCGVGSATSPLTPSCTSSAGPPLS